LGFFCLRFKNFPVFDRVWIGIKALLDLIEVARQADDGSRVVRFLAQLEEVAGMV
jgi:hypothetical protein